MTSGANRTITGRTRLAVVIGDPVSQSLSPVIHNAGFASTGADWTYAALGVTSAGLPSFVETVRDSTIGGVSVTMPHKADVARLVDELDESARALSSVNTIVRDDVGRLIGHSTDGDGLCDALVEDGVAVEGRTFLVIGAGGAARSIVDALVRRGAGSIRVHNRTVANAVNLLPLTLGRGSLVDHDELIDAVVSSEIVVNASSIGMGESVSPVPIGSLRKGQVVVDIVYHPLRTTLLTQAEEAGCHTLDGLQMLIHQAVRQQVLWTGVRPDVAAMSAAAGRALDGLR